MDKLLFAWIGNTDLKAAEGQPGVGKGPIAQAVANEEYLDVHLLNDHPAAAGKTYRQWLEPQSQAKVIVHPAKLDSPTDFRQIYEKASTLLQQIADERRGNPFQRVFHLSPGTPAMAAVWLLLGKTL
jgi:hypothetical protein